MDMPPPSRKRGSAIFLLMLILVVPFVLIYYLSTDHYEKRAQQWRRQQGQSVQERLDQSRVENDEVLLYRDERVKIDRTALQFNGYDDKTISLDLYLLDLDPKQPYHFSFSRKEAEEGIKMGGIGYRVDSVNEHVLKLKIVHRPAFH